MSRVSVVIPAHNRAGLLPRAIESVLGQSAPPAEIIVVDDGSTDATPEVLRRYGDRVRTLRLGRNHERGAARNAGAAIAGGELIAFLDSDDEWAPSKLERQLEVMRRGLTCLTAIRTSSGETYTPSRDSAKQLELFNPMLGAASSMLVERAALLASGGFPEARALQGSEDWLLLLALKRGGGGFTVVPEPLTTYHVHLGSSTQESANLARSMWWACERIERDRLADPATAGERRSRTAAAIGTACLSEGEFASAARWLGRAIREGRARTRGEAMLRFARTAVRLAVRRGPR